MNPFSLEGKTAVVTGSSRGIGRAIAIAYARAGAKVVVTSRKIEPCQHVVDEIRADDRDRRRHDGARRRVRALP